MEWSRDRGLTLRMAVTLALLGVVASVFSGTVYGITVLFLLLIESVTPMPAGSSVWLGVVVTGLLIWPVVYWEYSRDPLALQFVESLPTQSAADRSDSLQRTVERLAHQAGLPVPTVVIAESEFPTAYTSGVTPDRATIVLTTGLLEELDTEECQAVLAHELAHIKHRDVAVMTVASLPIEIARSIKGWADNNRYRTGEQNVWYIVSGGVWLVGRFLLLWLSRYRELAADRGAVALTGSPAALASAITKLSKWRDDVPAEDLRTQRTGSEAFSIVPIDTTVREPVRLGPDGERLPLYHWFMYPMRKLTVALSVTHPPLDRRLERLREIETEL